MPEPVTTVPLSGVADILGVSRQWAHELSKREGFPAPVLTTDLGRRWDRVDIELWGEQYRASQPGGGA